MANSERRSAVALKIGADTGARTSQVRDAHQLLRSYPDRQPPIEQPGHFLAGKITTGSAFRLRDRLLYLANAMVDQRIGLEETEDGVWSI